MADIRYRAELCPDRDALLERFMARRYQLLRSADGGLPGELEAVQRGISWLREHAAADANMLRQSNNASTSGP